MTKVGKISLVTEVITTNAIGQPISTETTSDIVAEVRSVTRSEFMEGSQNGLSPAYVFRISVFGYSNQRILSYNGTRYAIYRVYEADENYVELYAERQIGPSQAVSNG